MSKIRDYLNRHEGLRRVLRTFAYAFLGVSVPGALGWLHGLTEWANSYGQAAFPDIKSLAFLGVSAITAGSVAIVNGLGIWLENRAGKAILRGTGPGIIKDVSE